MFTRSRVLAHDVMYLDLGGGGLEGMRGELASAKRNEAEASSYRRVTRPSSYSTKNYHD